MSCQVTRLNECIPYMFVKAWYLKILIFFFCIDEEKQMNASYIISAARKLGCSIFLLPEDILEVINLIE